jgi:hypothetical protein
MHAGAPIAREGDPAPGTGGTFTSFGSVRVGAAGHVAFDAVIAGSPISRGVFLSSDGTTTLLAHTGEIAPGTASSYTSFAVLAVSDTGAVVYRAVL